MSFESMATRLIGYAPKLPKSEAYNLVQSAWREVRRNRLWSFQLYEDSWLSPNLVSGGNATVVAGSPNVTFDVTGSIALSNTLNNGLAGALALPGMQFRLNGLSIYSILAVNTTNSSAWVITLDRPVSEPSGTGGYQIYLAYVPAPVADFKRWISWKDMTNGDWLDIYSTRKEWDQADPQRLYFTFPHYVLPMQPDTRGAGSTTPSRTLGYPMWELYPNPVQQISYMRWGVRVGPDLDLGANANLPFPMTDNLVFPLAKNKAYEWAEANRDPSIPRGQVADYKFLAGKAMDDYNRELRLTGMQDRDLCDLYLSKIQKFGVDKAAYYNSITGRAYAGT